MLGHVSRFFLSVAALVTTLTGGLSSAKPVTSPPSLSPMASIFSLEQGLADWRPLLGFDHPLTYLVLFQNSAELRPTGGFWGSYSIVHLFQGKPVSFRSDDIYNLDKNVVGSKLMPEAPAMLQKYLGVQRWYLRDANWSPDFPTSAKQAIDFYQREGGREHLDGVVGITPEVLTTLLRLVGSVTVAGEQFTPEQAVEQLEYYVQVGYKEIGVPKSTRKNILQPLAEAIIARLVDKPPAVWLNVFTALQESLIKRDIQIFLVDQVLEQPLLAKPWSGVVRATNGDFLLMVDANMSALKSDPKVRRSLSYEVRAVGERLQATLRITYEHTAKEADWRTTDYRTYLRLFTPRGSRLIASSEKIVSTSEESGKTVLGTYVVVSLGQKREVAVTYELPFSSQQLRDHTYSLLVQRQAGTASYPLKVSVNPGAGKVPVIWQRNLTQDQTFSLAQ